MEDKRDGSPGASGDASGAVSWIQQKTGATVSGHPCGQFTLQRIVHNRPELDHFRAFLADNFASQDFDCWLEIESVRRDPDRPTLSNRSKLVVRKYFNDEYFYGPTSPASKHEQDKVQFYPVF